MHTKIMAVVMLAVMVIVTISNGIGNPSILAQTSKPNEGLDVGNMAPDFKLTDPLKGTIIKSNFTGKPLFIFFTTTYCTPCQIGAQNLARYDDETGGSAFNVLIVFVDPRESDSQFVDWKSKYGRNDWYVAAGEDMAVQYKVRYLDTKYVFDKQGVIKWVDLNPLEYAKAKQVLEPLI